MHMYPPRIYSMYKYKYTIQTVRVAAGVIMAWCIILWAIQSVCCGSQHLVTSLLLKTIKNLYAINTLSCRCILPTGALLLYLYIYRQGMKYTTICYTKPMLCHNTYAQSYTKRMLWPTYGQTLSIVVIPVLTTLKVLYNSLLDRRGR